MKKIHLIMIALAGAFALGLISQRLLADSKNNSGSFGATEAYVVFGSESGQLQLTAVDATSDKVLSKITVRARTSPASPYAINGSGSASQAVIPLSYTTGLASNDYCVVESGDRSYAPFRIRLIAVTSTNVTSAANLTSAVSSGDVLHELETIYTAALGSNSVNRTGSPLAITPKKSPMVVQIDSTVTNELSATIK